MPKYEVTTDLIVHCKIKVIVEADDKDAAIDAATDLLPTNMDPDRAKAWRAKVDLKPPRGVEITSVKAYHFEQASGDDKARKL
jgi:hypothetical protein